jgi:hypothetical protein
LADWDYAVIAQQSFAVFSSHMPLVGHYSTLSATDGLRNTVFDPGPFQYWVLAVPTHIDPVRGALWGSALWNGAVLSLAVEAAYRVIGWRGSAVVALAIADIAWLLPLTFTQPVWNPNFGFLCLFTTLVLSAAVVTHSFGWWVPMVLTASAACQSHLIFVILAISLVVVAPLLRIALNSRPTKFWWLAGGAFVGLACWLAPFIQELTGHPGNMTVILESGRGARLGLRSGLQALGFTSVLRPIWMTHSTQAFLPSMSLVQTRSPLVGVVEILLAVSIAVIAWRNRQMLLASIAAIGFVCSIATVTTYATFPRSGILALPYLLGILWLDGLLLWIVALWAVGLCVVAGYRRYGEDPIGSRVRTQRALLSGVRVLVLAAIIVVTVGAVRPISGNSSLITQETTYVPVIDTISTMVERQVPRGPVAVDLRGNFSPELITHVLGGVYWRLSSNGWQVVPVHFAAIWAGVPDRNLKNWSTFEVTLNGTKVISGRWIPKTDPSLAASESGL